MDNLEEMEKFLEKHSLLKLNQEEVENINRPTSTENETVTQNLPKKQKHRDKWLPRWILSDI